MGKGESMTGDTMYVWWAIKLYSYDGEQGDKG